MSASSANNPTRARGSSMSTPGLIERENIPVLVVAGNASQIDRWRASAREFGISHVQHVPAIPVDKRHHSKVDRDALRKLLA